jgi:hypothetical protein
VLDELRGLAIETLSPIEALNVLDRMQRKVR